MAMLAILSLLALLGSVACQDYSGSPSATPPAYPSSPSPIPATYPQGSSPSSSPPSSPPSSNPPSSAPSPMPSSYMKSASPSLSPPSYPPSTNPPSSAPSPRPSTYMKSVSPSSSPPSYPPSTNPPSSAPSPRPSTPSPSPTHSPSSSPSYPPSSNPPSYTGPSPRPSNIMKSRSPTQSPSYPPSSSNAPAYPQSSPGPSTSAPSPTYDAPGPSTTAYPPSPSPAPSGLSFGYYRYSCPNAEDIVRTIVKSFVDTYDDAGAGTGAGLIRLFFHDCFVQGCDASVLLNTTGSERFSPPNLSLRGFEVIDAAKTALEFACPGVVSCADIVAYAGRDATYILSGNAALDFSMPGGRYDGCVSRSGEALANLPPPTAGIDALKAKFAAKGLDADDMVTLSGAHTVGRSHCSSFSDRVPANKSDINPALADSLVQQCRTNDTVMQDLVTPNKLDSQYYWNVLNHDVLFASDAALLASNDTANMVSNNAFTPGLWEAKFKAAMVKMGAVGVKTSADGEIRKKLVAFSADRSLQISYLFAFEQVINNVSTAL
ncbi:hypothetical protein EJB05_10956, partial [Eragrostis curvula]